MKLIQATQEAPAPQTTQPAADPAAPQSPGWSMMLPIVLMFVVMWFVLLRPQKKQQKEREKMIANLKKNDHVVTNGGIYGIVKQVKAEDADLLLTVDEAKDVRIRVAKASITALVKAAGAEGAESKG